MKDFKEVIRLFFCGDVMTGRGIDQILSHPSQPQLYESYVKDARDYILLAEEANGKISYPVPMNYIWGDALTIWNEQQPDIKIINLETAITKNNEHWAHKGIHYRMNPENIDVLKTAGINICTLGNNHVLDWGYPGLTETLTTLKKADIQFSGAGETSAQAMQPAICNLAVNKRVLVFSVGTASSGVPSLWEATGKQSGIYFIHNLSDQTVSSISENISSYRKNGDLIILSIHWGSNWGYDIPDSFRSFTHHLIDDAKVDVIFGHSSHHPRPIEIYHGKPILYGCGDFINDYEGISGYEEYRGDLSLMYFLDFDAASLQFIKMILVPMQIKNFSLHLASEKDREWMLKTLNQSAPFTVPLKLQNNCLVYPS